MPVTRISIPADRWFNTLLIPTTSAQPATSFYCQRDRNSAVLKFLAALGHFRIWTKKTKLLILKNEKVRRQKDKDQADSLIWKQASTICWHIWQRHWRKGWVPGGRQCPWSLWRTGVFVHWSYNRIHCSCARFHWSLLQTQDPQSPCLSHVER